MKNKFLFLMMFLGVALFSGCSKDKPNYSGSYSVENLNLTLSGIKQTNKAVELRGNTVVLKNVIAGEKETTVPVTFDGMNFSGTETNADRTITVSGSVKEKVLQLDVAVKMNHKLVGTYTIYDKNITAKIEAPEGTELLFMTNKLTPAQLEQVLPTLTGSFPQAYLKDITFKENGYLVATYDAGGKAGKGNTWVTSPEGAVKWYVKGEQVYLVPDLGMIKASRSPAPNGDGGLAALLANGFPLNFTLAAEGLHVHVTKEQMLPLMDMVLALINTIEKPNSILGMAKMVIPEMKENMQKCTLFNLGMKMALPK